MSSILTNNSAMVALQTLKSINSNLEGIQSEISTGRSISNAKDNAAIWSIAKTMGSDVAGFESISKSLALGESTVALARGAAEQVTDILVDIKQKIVDSQEENVNRAVIQDDITALADQIASITGAAQFNGLNLVEGGDDVNVLASLDRASDGSVDASHITVTRQNLSETADTLGGGTDLTVATASDVGADASLTAADQALTFTVGTFTDGEAVSVDINGVTVSYTADNAGAGDTDVADVANGLAAAFATAQAANEELADITFDASAADGTFVVTNESNFDGVTIATTDGANMTLTAADADGDTNPDTSIGASGETVSIAEGASISENDSFELTIGEETVTYTARKGDTAEDVIEGLATAVRAGGFADVEIQTSVADGNNVLSLGNTSDTDIAFSLAQKEDGAVGGDLYGLGEIDVTTDKGAVDALALIETMISRSTDAAAAFGSSQGRIETQSNFIDKLTDSLTSGIGSLVDADMEEASAKLQALQVQQQLGVQALSIANQSPQSILSLFR